MIFLSKNYGYFCDCHYDHYIHARNPSRWNISVEKWGINTNYLRKQRDHFINSDNREREREKERNLFTNETLIKLSSPFFLLVSRLLVNIWQNNKITFRGRPTETEFSWLRHEITFFSRFLDTVNYPLRAQWRIVKLFNVSTSDRLQPVTYTPMYRETNFPLSLSLSLSTYPRAFVYFPLSLVIFICARSLLFSYFFDLFSFFQWSLVINWQTNKRPRIRKRWI